MKRLFLSFFVLFFFFYGCSPASTTRAPDTAVTEEKCLRLDGRRYSFDGNAEDLRAEEDCLTLLSGGVYRISGALSEGALRVCAPPDAVVRLILDGVSITSSYRSPLLLEEAACVILELPRGTVNRLTDAERGSDEGAIPNGCLVARCDLLLCGEGALYVSGREDAALVATETLRLSAATLSLSAVSFGVWVRDRLLMESGVLTVSASKTGIATDRAASSAGELWITGGRVVISATETALLASQALCVEGATLSLSAPKKYDAPKIRVP